MSEVRMLRRIADELSRASGEGLGPDEASALWAAVAGIKPAEVWLKRESEPAPDVVKRFWKAVEDRKRGVPFAYTAGRAGFRTLDLAIDPRALIPRPETEGLVDLVLNHGKRDAGNGKRGLAADIGAGSGCIALSLAVEGDFERIVAVEQSPGAAALARENVQRVAPRTPVEIREGNLLTPLVDKGEWGAYRVIVANPPYLTDAEFAELDPSVREFEPREALVSGAGGLDATRGILAGAGALLERGGLLALEIDERRADAVRALGRDYGWNVAIYNDVFGCPRYALSIKED
ncbi:MAG TPA: peptide chain release factor N(5)-glutamine methyltransferase [Gemmatimonadales bacterium]|nr:peptide chain release factor N(5)-glutamine methyltransferase [Gemmatimonadales bacterium]